MVLFTMKPADGTACLRIQVILYTCSLAVTPVDGTLILHIDMTSQPRVRTSTFIKHNQKQYFFGAVIGLLFLSIPTQRANTETFPPVTPPVCCGCTRTTSRQTVEVLSQAICQMYSGCSFTSLALIDQ